MNFSIQRVLSLLCDVITAFHGYVITMNFSILRVLSLLCDAITAFHGYVIAMNFNIQWTGYFPRYVMSSLH